MLIYIYIYIYIYLCQQPNKIIGVWVYKILHLRKNCKNLKSDVT